MASIPVFSDMEGLWETMLETDMSGMKVNERVYIWSY
jgi:hypothetical protein